jgi:glycosyltransferase involved in cell wall biosynthesis
VTETLSVVMPVHDEAPHLRDTIDALVAAVEGSGFVAELVLVDDGSNDGSAETAREALDRRLPFTLVAQENRGRFEARRAGLEAAKGDWVLLLDGRVRIDPGALAFAHERVAAANGRVWAGHVDVDAEGNPYGTFWKLIAELAWSDYFAEPRETSFGAKEFDRYPKGTTCFLAPRLTLLDAVRAFRSAYDDLRRANDDTPLLRWIVERERIHLSPRFRCEYTPRTTLATFVRHSVHRGVVFVDGHGRPESRFFPLAVAFYPVSALLALAAARRPSVAVSAALATSAAAAVVGLARRRSPFEIASLALLAPVYGAAHGIGMWRGLGLLARRGVREPASGPPSESPARGVAPR